jgi:hypothetical protein
MSADAGTVSGRSYIAMGMLSPLIRALPHEIDNINLEVCGLERLIPINPVMKVI